MCAHVRAAPPAAPAPLPRHRTAASCAPRATRSPPRGHSPTHNHTESGLHQLSHLPHVAHSQMHLRAMPAMNHVTPRSPPPGPVVSQHQPSALSPSLDTPLSLDLAPAAPLSPPISPPLSVHPSLDSHQAAAPVTSSSNPPGGSVAGLQTTNASGGGGPGGTGGGTSTGGGGGAGGGSTGNSTTGGGADGTGGTGGSANGPPAPGSGPQVTNGPPQPHPPPSTVSSIGTNLGDNINRMTRMLRLPWVRQYMLASSLSTDVGVLSNPLVMQAAVVCDRYVFMSE